MGGRQTGKTQRIIDTIMAMDPMPCGCATVVSGVVTDTRIVKILEARTVRCAGHDVIEGEVVRPALESGPVG